MKGNNIHAPKVIKERRQKKSQNKKEQKKLFTQLFENN